jgi:hypothetical protein
MLKNRGDERPFSSDNRYRIEQRDKGTAKDRTGGDEDSYRPNFRASFRESGVEYKCLMESIMQCEWHGGHGI